MSEARAIGFGAALVEQLRWFWQRLWLWVVLCTVIAAGGALWILASLPDEASPLAFILLGSAFHPLLVLVALSWALSAWRDDPPKDRQYFWLQPVERTSHTIARTLAGFLWLLAVVAVVLATIAIMSRGLVPPEMAAHAWRLWLYSAAGVLLAYLASSVAAVLSDRPVIWIILIVALVVILTSLAQLPQLDWLRPIMAWFTGGPLSFGTALGAPSAEATRIAFETMPPDPMFVSPGMERAAHARPGAALLIWLPIAAVAYLAAARFSRPR